jgi:Icc-related predicted phosphoesterase
MTLTPPPASEPAPVSNTAGGPTAADLSIRVAAVGDLHATSQSTGTFHRELLGAAADADVVLVAGDVTHNGRPEEARCVADQLRDLGAPVVATLGNHDHHSGHPEEVAAILAAAGVRVLEGTGVVLTIRGVRLGIGGVKGFGGGFPVSGVLHEFGEPQMKGFVAHARESAEALAAALAGLAADVRVALSHYAPVPDTLAGEPLGLWPALGSHLLGQAIDRSGVALAVHGHAHHGTGHGRTPGGVPVRNVARQVLQGPYGLYRLTSHARGWTVTDIGVPPQRCHHTKDDR